MTRLLEDIQKEPAQLSRALNYTLGAGRPALRAAAEIVRCSAHIYIVGTGASWHAGIAAQSAFLAHGYPALLFDASELLHFSEIPLNAAVILLSRSWKSVEIVGLIEKARARRAKLIAITNTLDSPLARESDIVLPLMADFDHQVSISMYSLLALVSAMLVHETAVKLDHSLATQLEKPLAETSPAIPSWKNQIDSSDWLQPDAPTYFLARGASLASCYGARLLWEEAAKAPASALTTGNFRHGPQEVVRPGLRIGLWIDGEKMRAEDLALASDLRRYGAKVLAIGRGLPASAADLVLGLPSIPAAWQFLIDIIPIQIAAERLAQRRGENCDAFRLCSYIVEAEGGLKTAV